MTVNTNPVDWAVKMLDEAETVEDVRLILKTSARAAVRAQGATVVELEGDQCYYADEDAMSPLWKGQRFPVTVCISGWAILNRKTAVVPDVRVDGRVPQEAYRPTFVRSLVVAPIIVGEPVGALGVYWAHHHVAPATEVARLESLAAAAARALRRIDPALGRQPVPAPGQVAGNPLDNGNRLPSGTGRRS